MLESGEAGRPKLLYTVPTFANPTGATLPRDRRVALVDLALRYGFLIVEDDPYGELRFSGTPLPSLRALADGMGASQEHVVYLGSLSKIVAPGLRVGWMVGPADVIRRCVVAKQTADLCSVPWTQAIAALYLAQGSLADHLLWVTSIYRSKCDTLCDQLKVRLGDAVQFERPEGGLFVWARIDGADASELLKYAIARKVLFVPGKAFFVDHVDPSALRLSFAAPCIAEIMEAASRLASAFKTMSGCHRDGRI